MKSIGIMQPYFFPYIGYYQLMNAVDEFVVYDQIQFTKKGWIHRNRFLSNGSPAYFSLAIKKDSDYKDVVEREISETFDKAKLLRQLQGSYRNAPHYATVFPVVEQILMHNEPNLFAFLLNSLEVIKDYLSISTPLIVSSSIQADHSLKGKDRVIDIVKTSGGNKYINPIGGVELYDKSEFADQDIELSFIKAEILPYQQSKAEFVPALSILDVMMFNALEEIQEQHLPSYSFV